LPTPVLMGDFNFPDICWKYSTAASKRAYLVGAPQDLLFTNREGLVEELKVRRRLGQNGHETVEFSILGEVRRGASKTATLDF